MTDRRHNKNNAAKAAARALQGDTGMSYREALSVTRTSAEPHTEVSLGGLIGTCIGHTSANVFLLCQAAAGRHGFWRFC